MKSQIRGRFHPFSDYELEAYLCDELDLDTRARLLTRLRTDVELAEYLRTRAEQAQVFAAEHPLAFDPERITVRRRSNLSPRHRGFLAACFASASALAALWIVARPMPPPASSTAALPPDVPDHVRVKGHGLHAVLYIKRAGKVFEHVPGSALAPGDRVRLGVDDPDGGYLTVLGLDAHERLSVYYDAVRLKSGRTFTPDSLLLEDREMDERWLIVMAAEPRSAELLAQRWRRGELGADRHTELRIRTGR